MPLLLAQSIESVPADFLKHLLITVLAIGGAWVAYQRGKSASGRSDDPLSIAQPLHVRKATEWATREEMERLDDRMETLMQAFNAAERSINASIVHEARVLHERLNPVAESMRGHEATLEQIESRLEQLERSRHEEIGRINQRIDDALRSASAAARKS